MATHEEHRRGAHETRDVHYRPIVLSAIAFFGFAIVAVVVLRPVFAYLRTHTETDTLVTTPAPEVRPPPVGPRAEIAAASGQQLIEIRAEAMNSLQSYGWVDREKGAVRIPIERAIELVAQRGLPVRDAPVKVSGETIPGGETNGFSKGGAP